MTKPTTAERLLEVLDEAIKPRELQRNAPPDPPEPVIRCRLVRPVIVAAYAGQDICVGDILFLSRSEIGQGLSEGWAVPLENFPTQTAYEGFYAD